MTATDTSFPQNFFRKKIDHKFIGEYIMKITIETFKAFLILSLNVEALPTKTPLFYQSFITPESLSLSLSC